MNATELIDRRIAELEHRLDELRALRGLLTPATVPVLPTLEPQSEPVKVPAPNAARPGGDRTPTPAVKTPERKPGRPSGRKKTPDFLSDLQRERAVLLARALDDGPKRHKELIAATRLDNAQIKTVLNRYGYPSFADPTRTETTAYFTKRDGGKTSPWMLTALGRSALLGGASTAASVPTSTPETFHSAQPAVA